MKKYVHNLKGLKIKDVITGSLNSSIIQIIFDDSTEDGCYLMINCSWRLSQSEKILTGWNDIYDSVNSNYKTQLDNLIGSTVMSIRINAMNDLKISFNSNKQLDIFSDLYSFKKDNDYENWDFCLPKLNICYSVSNDGSVIKMAHS